MREMKNKKRLGVIGAAVMSGLLLVSTTTVVHAATIKQGTACTVKGKKTKVGTNPFTCTTNPSTTSNKLVWVSAECISADASYKKTSAQMRAFADEQAKVIVQIQASIDASTALIATLNKQVDDAKHKTYNVGTDRSVKPALPITAVGIDAAIAAWNQKIAQDTIKRDNAAAQRDATKTLLLKTYTDAQVQGFAADLSGSIRNADKNVQNYANWIRAYVGYSASVTSAQRTIDNLNKPLTNLASRIARTQAQIDSLTIRKTTAQTQQAEQAKQFDGTLKDLTSLRTTSCK